MSKTRWPLSSVPDPALAYILDIYADRERLYTQYELSRSDFNEWLDRALFLGNLSTDPKTATWRALDAGCGEGLFAAEILRRYPHAHIVGFDKDSAAIATANLVFAPNGDVRFYVHDILDELPPQFEPESNRVRGGDFDLAIAHQVLMHLRAPAMALTNVMTALRQGGVIYLRDSPIGRISFSHPSMASLYSVTSEAMRHVANVDFAERHTEYLAQAGFVQIESGTHVYTIGGPTTEGQSLLVNLVSALKAARHGIVDGLHLMTAKEFDIHMQRITSEITPDLTGEMEIVNTIARKPTRP